MSGIPPSGAAERSSSVTIRNDSGSVLQQTRCSRPDWPPQSLPSQDTCTHKRWIAARLSCLCRAIPALLGPVPKASTGQGPCPAVGFDSLDASVVRLFNSPAQALPNAAPVLVLPHSRQGGCCYIAQSSWFLFFSSLVDAFADRLSPVSRLFRPSEAVDVEISCKSSVEEDGR